MQPLKILAPPSLKIAKPRKASKAKVPPVPYRRLRAAGGALVGLFIPCAVFALVHGGMDHTQANWYWCPLAIPVAAGLVFSAKTVCVWVTQCFGDWSKGLAWTVIAEVIMTFAPVNLAVLQWVALTFLATINGVASGVIAYRGPKVVA